eukprot:m.73014 g.73014  ORF g.73014 m.73014 type:complete len:72 (-) comp8019_c0_seq1:227-442(-)
MTPFSQAATMTPPCPLRFPRHLTSITPATHSIAQPRQPVRSLYMFSSLLSHIDLLVSWFDLSLLGFFFVFS